jgi:hypothetical protein
MLAPAATVRRLRALVAALALGLALSSGARLARAEPTDDRLHEAEALYAKGAYGEAAKEILPLLVADETLSPERRAQAYLMKARLELAFARGSEWRLWLAKAHRAFPALGLDPVKDPPQLLAHWKELQASAGEAPADGAPPAPEATARRGALAALTSLLPLGVGHFEDGQVKSGALFLATESLVLLASATLPRPDDAGDDLARWRRARVALSTIGLLGAYGYEVLDILPVVSSRDEDLAQAARAVLPIAPFGVGQVANGEATKGATIAALEAVALTIGVLADSSRQQRGAAVAFAALWAYGTLDAYAHLVPSREPSAPHATLAPFLGDAGIGLAFTAPLP